MVSEPELEGVLDRMKGDWDERARQDAERSVYTRDSALDVEGFAESGRANYDQLVRPFLPVLLEGRPARRCRVVEIGCGLGRMTRWFAEEFREVHGVDVSERMIEEARARLRECRNARLHAGSGKDLRGLPDEAFDLAFSYIVFQHIPSRAVIESYVREAARVLRRGGAFKFQLNGNQSPEYLRCPKDSWWGESFSEDEAAAMLERAGFHLMASEGAGTQYFVLTARKGAPAGEPHPRSYIFAGQPWAAGQLLEGWYEPVENSWRPIAPLCRTRLAVPAGESRRFFVGLYCWPEERFAPRTLTATLDHAVLGTGTIGGKGEHYFEWPVRRGQVPGPEARLTLEVRPPCGRPPALRALGLYVPRTAEYPVSERRDAEA